MPDQSEALHVSGIQHSAERMRLGWLADLHQDLRFTLRHLARSPGFALITALTIALGVGAATTVFSVMNGLLFRTLPVPWGSASHGRVGCTPRRWNNLLGL